MAIREPIIVFGTGRCGSTVFTSMLSAHPRLAWLSGLCDFYPDKPILNRLLMRSLDYRLVQRFLLLKSVQKKINASESYSFWDYHCKAFSNPCRDLLPTDVTEKNKRDIHEVLSQMTTARRNRLLLKVTGWSRLGFLSEVFKDARFIRVIRDGRAVANSLLNVYFWWGWRGPQNWRWGSLSPADVEEWNRYNQSFIVLAAIQWKMTMDAAERAKQYINPCDLMEIKYERLCADPIGVFKEVARFAELEWTNHFEKDLRRYHLINANNRWEVDLTEKQQRELNQVLQGYLRKYGYLDDASAAPLIKPVRRAQSITHA